MAALTWETGACIVDAPATHDNDGVHIILYRSADNTGLVEAPRSCTVRIDTRQPVTAAPYSTKVRRGDRATLRYRVDDQQPCASKANVTIKVATLSGRVVQVLKLGQRAVNRTPELPVPLHGGEEDVQVPRLRHRRRRQQAGGRRLEPVDRPVVLRGPRPRDVPTSHLHPDAPPLGERSQVEDEPLPWAG